MTGKTGAARIALETGCPVIPVGQWGANEAAAVHQGADLPRKTHPHEGRRPGGPGRPGRPGTHGRARSSTKATARIMTALTRDRRGAARRDRAGRAVRPAQMGVKQTGNPHRSPRKKKASEQDQGRRLRRRVVGHRVLDPARRRRERGVLWGRREEAAAINDTAPEPRLPARHRAARHGLGHARTREAVHAPRRSSSRGPVSDLRENLEDWVELIAPRRRHGLADEGRRARHPQADERGDRRGPARGPTRVAVVSGPNLSKEIARREPAASVVACTDEDRRQAAPGGLPPPYSAPTPTSTCSAASSVGAVKNVVGLAVGMAVGWASATTPRPR